MKLTFLGTRGEIEARTELRAMAEERGVEAELAYDGLALVLR